MKFPNPYCQGVLQSRQLAKQTVVQGEASSIQKENTSFMSTDGLSHQLGQVRANPHSTV